MVMEFVPNHHFINEAIAQQIGLSVEVLNVFTNILHFTIYHLYVNEEF